MVLDVLLDCTGYDVNGHYLIERSHLPVLMQGILPSTDVIQSPTSLEVQEAEASIKPPLARRPSSSSMLLTSLSRKILGPKSLHASHDDFSRMDDHPGPNAVSGGFQWLMSTIVGYEGAR